jgi:hypothetical protein
MDKGMKLISYLLLGCVLADESMIWILFTHNALPDFHGLKGWMYFLVVPILGMAAYIEIFLLKLGIELWKRRSK